MKRAIDSLPLLYLVMLLPGWSVIVGLITQGYYYPEMLRISGVWSVRLLVLTVAVTPALLVIRRIGYGKALGRWLLKRRRHFGLASFVYAALHTAHYLVEAGDLGIVISEGIAWDYGSGWIAFAIMAALAATSTDFAVRRLGRWWKTLHRATYGAAAMTFLHWYLFDFFADQVAFWAGLFVAAKLIHAGLRRWPMAVTPPRRPGNRPAA